jgi:hypothetical protein
MAFITPSLSFLRAEEEEGVSMDLDTNGTDDDDWSGVGAHAGFETGATVREAHMEVFESAATVDDNLEEEAVSGFIELALDLEAEDGAECTEMSSGFSLDTVSIYLVD